MWGENTAPGILQGMPGITSPGSLRLGNVFEHCRVRLVDAGTGSAGGARFNSVTGTSPHAFDGFFARDTGCVGDQVDFFPVEKVAHAEIVGQSHHEHDGGTNRMAEIESEEAGGQQAEDAGGSDNL